MFVLVVEDNRDIAENIGSYLEEKDHVVDYAADGVTGLHLASVNDYDVIVLDLMLPALDGLELCRKLRAEARKSTPVLMLTARDTLDDKLAGFSAGSDDYLVKPFSLLELEARLLALVRRSASDDGLSILQVGDLEYNPETLTVTRAGKTIKLKPTTMKILEMLLRANHRVLKRSEIEMEIWGDNTPDGDVLRAHIYAIRNAIDKPFPVKLLHTIHGVGYQLTDQR